MKLKLHPAPLSGTIEAIASKSQMHRFALCAALADGPCEIFCKTTSLDIQATISCLNAMGASIQRNGETYLIEPIKQINRNALLDCGESGSTLRFLLPLVCVLGLTATITGSGRLPNRPLSPLYEELVTHGATLSPKDTFPIHCQGKLIPGTYCLPGNITSQFASGLLFALPLLGGDSTVTLSGKLESKGYIEMTLEAMALFGVNVTAENGSYYIPGNQTYRSPGKIEIEGDWSNAAFWLAAGALAAPVQCSGLQKNSRQGDRKIVSLLREFGATVEEKDSQVRISAAPLHGISIDASDIPDLVPILSVIASAANGTTTIYNAGRLRIKESDRLKTTAGFLKSLGADITETNDGFVIRGKPCLTGGTVDACNDHRIAMSSAIASILCKEPVTLTGAESVQKSYPEFFEDFSRLGGRLLELGLD